VARRRRLSPAAVARVQEIIAPAGRVLRVRPLHGGISSSVHLVHLETADGRRDGVIVRRCGPYMQRTDPGACEREFRLLEVLTRCAQPVPRPLYLDALGGPFGAPTILMTRVPGRPLLAPRDQSAYLDQIARALARLHAVPTTDLQFLPDQRIYVQRALGDDRAPSPSGDRLQNDVWAAARRLWPGVASSVRERALLHGDYWPGNLLWLRQRLVGIVDWEQPLLGDPARDVATCRGDLSILFGLDAADEFQERYLAASGTALPHLGFWNLLISTWAVREIAHWAVVYPLLGRPDLTPAIALQNIRRFAEQALASAES
jgi:aminoglycoside phosphotransferase (APT) family kinase protein